MLDEVDSVLEPIDVVADIQDEVGVFEGGPFEPARLHPLLDEGVGVSWPLDSLRAAEDGEYLHDQVIVFLDVALLVFDKKALSLGLCQSCLD